MQQIPEGLIGRRCSRLSVEETQKQTEELEARRADLANPMEEWEELSQSREAAT